jgi:DNA (cytosine-5)-methyltransferase 1
MAVVYETAHTLRGEGFDASEDGTGRGSTPLVPVAIRTANTNANGHGIAEDVTHTIDQAQGQAVAFEPGVMSRCGGHHYEDISGCLRKEPGDNQMSVSTGMQVRRLTPVECERLQGFPDGYTDIQPNGKPTPDGPRYKALGNSMAVPVMNWIGMRIQMVEDLE